MIASKKSVMLVLKIQLGKLNKSMCSHLLSKDPVVCCVYFQKLIDTIMSMLKSKWKYNPNDHLLCAGLLSSHRISASRQSKYSHSNILLWLENDSKESVSESMEGTSQLITDLCSVIRDNITDEKINNQIHGHMFTCTKRGENIITSIYHTG